MTPAARISAVIEVLEDLDRRQRPLNDVLRDWGGSHRFAGSGDRAAISVMAHDALRRRSSARFVMGADSARATALGAMIVSGKLSPVELDALCDGGRFAPSPLTDGERHALATRLLADAPAHVRGDYPEWLVGDFDAAFGEAAAEEGAALAERAPLDLRVNTLKSLRLKVLPELEPYVAVAGELGPDTIRIPARPDGRMTPIQADPLYLKGLVEIQDQGSQIVSRLALPEPGFQVLDLCAGGGGKSLALASLMNNKGQIFATDTDLRRLAPIHERIERAGARNIQVLTPRAGKMPLDGLEESMDIVFIDAPCSGTGTWRRNPDAKWRMRPGSLEIRQKEQSTVLRSATRFVKPGGLLAYVTCSVLPAENDQAIDGMLAADAGFAPVDVLANARTADLPGLDAKVRRTRHGILLTPLKTGTDGFFFAAFRRQTT